MAKDSRTEAKATEWLMDPGGFEPPTFPIQSGRSPNASGGYCHYGGAGVSIGRTVKDFNLTFSLSI